MFHENPSGGNSANTCGQTKDMTKLMGDFRYLGLHESIQNYWVLRNVIGLTFSSEPCK
jgi:hypothetical protein